MVSKKIINKTISDILKNNIGTNLKLKNDDYNGDVSTIPSRVKGQLNKFNKKTRNLDHETYIIINNNGDIIGHSEDGGGSSIMLDWDSLTDEESHNDENFHFTHNHPHDNENMMSNTLLSREDIMQISKYKYWDETSIDDKGNIIAPFRFKSITAEGSNGSRMTITMVDEDKFRKKAFDKNGDSINLRKAVFKYEDSIRGWVESANNGVYEHVEKWSTDRANELRAKGGELDLQAFLDETDNEKMRYQKKYSQEHLKEYFQDDFKRFNDMGLEVSIGWLK